MGTRLSCGQTLKQVASDLGVSPECLRSWRRQMEVVGPIASDPDESAASSAPSSNVELALSRELGQLRRELEAMTRQRDILKKVVSIFSEDKTLSGGSK